MLIYSNLTKIKWAKDGQSSEGNLKENIESKAMEALDKCKRIDPKVMAQAISIVAEEIRTKAPPLNEKVLDAINQRLDKEANVKLDPAVMRKAFNSVFGKFTSKALGETHSQGRTSGI